MLYSLSRVAAFALLLVACSVSADEIDDFTGDMEKQAGYYTFYIDAADDALYLAVPKQSDAFIFQSSLPRGVGSNDLGLDRGQLGKTRLAEFSVHGDRVLLSEKNTDYQALTDNDAERRSVEEAFAESVLWGFDVVAQSDDHVLIDYTPFLYTDIHGIGPRLKELDEGDFSVDATRSVLWPERTKSFPQNIEFEAKVTFTGDGAGQYVRSVTPEPTAITVHLHHSFIALPDDGYQPRSFHPTSGYYARGFQDYAAPLGESMDHRFITRHRLEKKDPTAQVSEAVEPIVYYLDPGVPEPVRTALLEGARWWSEGFEAIGFKDAFVVQDLPDDADPMDVRYNVIQWVHRATRGWSYGSSVTDPRTGEILKGHVTLGSLRVRQDMLIAQGLLAPFAEGRDSEQMMADIEAMALNRIRQLSAHEIGHTLGIAHNFAANSQDRASVMDYPHPLVTLTGDGEITLRDAYDTGLGVWDKFTVAYGYSQFASADEERQALQALLDETKAQGLNFISDRDARPVHGGHPTAHLWNNGADATDELERLIDIRRTVMAHFGTGNLAPNRPLDELEQVFVPMYLLHRYQVEGAVKLVGGMHYRYLLNGAGEPDYRPVEANAQNRALNALLGTLEAEFLTIPEHIEALLVPKTYGSDDSREDFPSRWGLFTDPVTIAETSAHHTLQLLFNAERMNRLHWQARDNEYAELAPVSIANRLLDQVLSDVDGNPVRQRIAYLSLYHLVNALHDERTVPEVRGQFNHALNRAQEALASQSGYYATYLAGLIADGLDQGAWPEAFSPASMPPGSPI
ncbi:peptidase [Aliidiomarina sedimenti]|uniref:Peptidase n=1 Tax=Aliidiomarina sedimenti TaxID=1933879 RepID=A0ABY0C0I8_9GAMM|nr:zinc-dependent metalloprotease [Aliidiomarina sedimenti]RUO30820.1 peptidase [Aliidiomarina sedimenti]